MKEPSTDKGKITYLKKQIAEKDKQIAKLKCENFDRTSFIDVNEYKLKQERSRVVQLNYELSESKKNLKNFQDRIAAVADDRDFFADILMQTAEDYDEMFEMATNLKNEAEQIKAESDQIKQENIQLMAKYESLRCENFDKTSFIAATEYKLRREHSLTVNLSQELSESKAALKSLQDRITEISEERNLFADALRKTTADHDEIIAMTRDLRNRAELMQWELRDVKQNYANLQFIHDDTLESAKFKAGVAVVDALKNPFKLFILPVKLIIILIEKRKYDKLKKAE